jgi:hypothetical protein
MVGDLIRSEVIPGNEAIVEHNFQETRARVELEPATIAWFAFRVGLSTFGVFDVFHNEGGRQAHLVPGTERLEKISELFVENSLVMEKVDVLTAKLPR